jgi:hypothetical protein
VDNDIYDNREAGVYILYRGNPIVRLGYIHWLYDLLPY